VQSNMLSGIDADDVLEQRDMREIRQEEHEETLQILTGGVPKSAPTIEAEDLADMDALLGLGAMSVSVPVSAHVDAPVSVSVPAPVPQPVPTKLPPPPTATASIAPAIAE
jgi:hypothetical protein